MKIVKRSGSYSCRIYDKVQKKEIRLTAPTRQKLMQKVNDYKCNGSDKMALGQAIQNYIDIKEGVLSPSTIRSYYIMQKSFKNFNGLLLSSLNAVTVQGIVNSWVQSGASPKTIKNRFSLMRSACKIYDVEISATLPQAIKPQLVEPTAEHIDILLQYYAGSFMECILLLAIYGPLRRGEICALKWDDIRGNNINVSKTITTDKNGVKTVKNAPKTYAGFRVVEFPAVVIEKLQALPHDSEYIFNISPKNLSDRFARAVKRLGLPAIRFHDLRHYSASYFHSLGVPDKYIIKRGGWESESIMRRVYQTTIDEKEKAVNALISANIKI